MNGLGSVRLSETLRTTIEEILKGFSRKQLKSLIMELREHLKGTSNLSSNTSSSHLLKRGMLFEDVQKSEGTWFLLRFMPFFFFFLHLYFHHL
jgi:hypothetical protein